MSASGRDPAQPLSALGRVPIIVVGTGLAGQVTLPQGEGPLAVLAQLREEHYGYSLRKALADQGLEIDDFSRGKMDATAAELAGARVEDQRGAAELAHGGAVRLFHRYAAGHAGQEDVVLEAQQSWRRALAAADWAVQRLERCGIGDGAAAIDPAVEDEHVRRIRGDDVDPEPVLFPVIAGCDALEWGALAAMSGAITPGGRGGVV